MKPSQILAELLAQHAQIRGVMATTRAIAARARSGEAVGDELRASLTLLADAVHAHNLREEELLRGLIPLLDFRGPSRAAIMSDEHILEHNRLHTALHGLSSAPLELAGVGVVSLLALMLEHMEREEAVLLREDVLFDELGSSE